jgi:hypothetical protein
MNDQEIEQAYGKAKKAEPHPYETEPEPMPVYKPRLLLAVLASCGLFVFAIGGFVCIVWTSRAFSNASDRVSFITEASIAFALLLVAIVQVGVYWSQRRIMNAQGYAMVAQADAARRAAYMATGQLVAMQHQEQAMFKALDQNERVAEKMQGQLEAIKGQEAVMKDQLTQMKVQSAASEAQFETTAIGITTAEKSAIYANRAYLVAKIRNDEPYHFKLAIENGGNTPANNVRVNYTCRVMQDPPWRLDEQTKQIVYDIGFDIEVRLGVIAPNGSHGTVQTVAFTPHTDSEKQEWEHGVKLYCWGRIYYEDMFNEGRHTDFCFYKSYKQPQGYPCEYGNEVL